MDNNTTIDWSNLSFGYMKTDYNVRCAYKDGKWGEVEVTDSEYLNIHMAATCLHYGQEIFEGLKAFRAKTARYASSVLRRMQNAFSAVPRASRWSHFLWKNSVRWLRRW